MKLFIIVLIVVSVSVGTSALYCLYTPETTIACCEDDCPPDAFKKYMEGFSATYKDIHGVTIKGTKNTEVTHTTKRLMIWIISKVSYLAKKMLSIGHSTDGTPGAFFTFAKKMLDTAVRIIAPVTYVLIHTFVSAIRVVSRDMTSLLQGIHNKTLRSIFLEILDNLYFFGRNVLVDVVRPKFY